MNIRAERPPQDPAGRWFHRLAPRPAAALTLVCVPHAGAGTAAFGPWADLLPPEIEPVAVRLPGRESRLRDPVPSDWPALAQEFSLALERWITGPYLLFGHSMGAMLVYEAVVRGLARPPVRVLLSGCRAPHVPRALPAIHDLPTERFRAELGRLAGTPGAVIAAPRLMALLEPSLRADIRLAETWSRPAGAADVLPVPATVFAGLDDAVAPPAAVSAWQSLAPHGFRRRQVGGGHFFPYERAPEFLGLLNDELALCLGTPRRSHPS
ncbi:alpha/beta fold hydrolase [Streptomyces clavifer]|uniref:thioesterase II family protein n=1 Tax=Streptomyces TaxID=1883 RepID=UPI000F5520E1|nr:MULTISPECIES: alpha/beta fold hydrolase [Streptomyces]RPK75864.1 Linear gramicidin dehydrogenase LgrE [Streptomyces sp. ADI97-07]WUC27722.1 alpha/beta fold hydrolase [Streptomyces clavifer]